MMEKCKPLIELFTDNSWTVEIEEDYLPDSHFNKTKENYQKFTGGRISFTKKQALSGLYSNGTLVEVFPKIDGFGVDFIIEDNAEGLDYTFKETDMLLSDAEATYKEHSEFLAELHKHQEGQQPQIKRGKQTNERKYAGENGYFTENTFDS